MNENRGQQTPAAKKAMEHTPTASQERGSCSSRLYGALSDGCPSVLALHELAQDGNLYEDGAVPQRMILR